MQGRNEPWGKNQNDFKENENVQSEAERAKKHKERREAEAVTNKKLRKLRAKQSTK